MPTCLTSHCVPARPALVSGDALSNGLDRIAFACLCSFVLLLPSEEHFPLLGGFLISRWLGLLAMGTALLRVAVTLRMRRLTALHGLMVALVFWADISFFWSQDPESTAARIGTYLQLLVMVWLIWSLAFTSERVRALLLAYVLGTWAPSIVTLHDFVLGRSLPEEYAGTGYAGYDTSRYAAYGINANDLGLILALSVPISLYFLAKPRSRIVTCLSWVQLGMSSSVALLTGSRGGLIALAAAFSMFPLILPALPKCRKRLFAVLLAGILVGSACIVPAATWQRLLTTATELEGGTMTKRTLIWSAGLNVFSEHPLLGVGAGAYAASVLNGLGISVVAHNTFLSILVELGIIGELLMVALLVGMFYCAIRMPYLEKCLWTVLLLTWAVGVSALTWEYRKGTWFLLGMLAAHAACHVRKARRPACIGPGREGWPAPWLPHGVPLPGTRLG